MTGAATQLVLRKPYLLFLGDVDDLVTAKTACGLRDWAGEDVVGQWRTDPGAVDLGLPDLTPAEAAARGAGSVIVGAAPAGGRLPDHWVRALAEAAACGLDVVSGLHSRLSDSADLVAAAARAGVKLHDIRKPPTGLPVATGRRRTGRRLLTCGADCALGKKYAALAIAREMARRGWPHDFRATGQTGIMIAGGGVPLDCVVADFVAGAAEALSPDADPDHWDIVEGQGALFHPAYAGVTLGLIHGSQPDAIIYCHSLTRHEIDGWPGYRLPDPATGIAANLAAARLTNPGARLAGIAVNTSHLEEAEARAALARLAKDQAAPAIDPLRFGAADIVDFLAAWRP
jgi:uncharacterized NAD-dependent epimerase/dehydratase family protein